MNNNIEELITALYDMIQDAKSVPLSSDKCMIEREKALDILDELSAQMPDEVKQARTIVQSREELVSQARREAETAIRAARSQADEMVKQENIYQESKRLCEQMVLDTQNRINELKRVSNDYVDNSLRQTEEAIAKALNDLHETRARFQSLSGAAQPQVQMQPQVQENNFASFDQPLDY